MEIALDRAGAVVAAYSKHHLVPVAETLYAEPGPFAPTTFELEGLRWGAIICYEGVYPSIFGDWSQMDALKQQGAELFLWAIGGMVADQRSAPSLARKYSLPVVAAEDEHGAVFVNSTGNPFNSTSVLLRMANYTAHASIAVADISVLKRDVVSGLPPAPRR
uniref:CN hydrolase domain-containing protein n=1 Tax=Haptolina ericina TaxID=156174 RepID=A0A7S3ASD0_9EUKA|mmetsp:Transcript_33300/g.75286  ORF Transcript_33300/g.75286 Transcript_33300/m.75286 type:complete len:162 (+) Transcript_33300:1-486(+)